MHLVVLDADATRISFEAACHRLGDGEARRAFSMASNGRRTRTKRQLWLPSAFTVWHRQ